MAEMSEQERAWRTNFRMFQDNLITIDRCSFNVGWEAAAAYYLNLVRDDAKPDDVRPDAT